jgi:hypothetical protein
VTVAKELPQKYRPTRGSALRPKKFPWLEPALCLLVLFLAAISPQLVPFNMDEFSHYHQLGCVFDQLSAEYNHNFPAACGEYDLKPPGMAQFLPLRSYIYIGAFQLAPFLVFWGLVHDPVAGRIQGAIYLLLASWLLAKLVRVPWRHSLFACLILPAFCTTFVLDTGTAGILICMLLGVMLLIRQAAVVETPGARFGLGLAVGLLTALAISVKPVFFWVMPAIALWTLWQLWAVSPGQWLATVRRNAPFLSAVIVSFAIPALLLLFSVDRNGHYYANVVASGDLSLRPSALVSKAMWLTRLIMDGSMFYYRVMALNGHWLLDALPASIGLLVIAAGLLINANGTRNMLLLFLGLAALTFSIITTSGSAWAAHHVVFALIFAVAAVAMSLPSVARHRQTLWTLAVLSGAYWLSIGLRLPGAYVHTDTNFDKDRLTQFIRSSGIDATTVQVHVDWGTYYLNHTFGDHRQLVLTVFDFMQAPAGLQHDEIKRIHEIAAKLQRDVLLITQSTTGLDRRPIIVDELGKPVATYAFNTWKITRYHY